MFVLKKNKMFDAKYNLSYIVKTYEIAQKYTL